MTSVVRVAAQKGNLDDLKAYLDAGTDVDASDTVRSSMFNEILGLEHLKWLILSQGALVQYTFE